MTKPLVGWVVALMLAAVLAIPLGCGSDKDAPVYDTAANPHGFPKAACDMLDAIEAGRLVYYDVITGAFGRLYLENQELLENEHWKEIITRLGGKFHSRADELIKRGVQSYSLAAGFYILASFSAPDDTQFAKKAALFTTWKEMMERVDAEYACSPVSQHLADRLVFVRHFVFGDSLQIEFARQFLVHQLLDSLLASGGNNELLELSKPDRALLSYVKLSDRAPVEPVGQFTGPAVDLIAYRLVAVAPGRSRLELYMESHDAITIDYQIMLSFVIPVQNDEGIVELETVIIEFDPITPTSHWKSGETMPATTVLAHSTELSQGHIVLVADLVSSITSSTPIDISLVAEIPCSH